MSSRSSALALQTNLGRLVEYYQKQLQVEAKAKAYLEKRKISELSVARFHIGYENISIGFSADRDQYTGYMAGRIVFPIVDTEGNVVEFVGRSIEDKDPLYKPLLGHSQWLFNASALESTEDIILVSGIFDVLSLEQISLPSVAVPDCFSFSKDHIDLFSGKRVFICFGNDDYGRREMERVGRLLATVALDVYMLTLPSGVKDVNDLFASTPGAKETFMQMLNQAIQTHLTLGIPPDRHFLTVYGEEYSKRYRGRSAVIPTGLPQLDAMLLGGFQAGLYVLAGPAETLNTTLIRQMADTAAGRELPSVFFAWGVSCFELWANSVSRFLNVPVRYLLTGRVPVEQVEAANNRFSLCASHMWTIEGTHETTLDEIASQTMRIAGTIGRVPAIYLDYLQRIPHGKDAYPIPSTERTGLVAYSLQRLARDHNVPVIVTALENGAKLPDAVEAASDVLMRLELEKDSDRFTDFNVRIRICKNRNGDIGSVPLYYKQTASAFIG